LAAQGLVVALASSTAASQSRDFPLHGPGPLRIGRETSCDLVVSDLRVSRSHGVLRMVGDNWIYEDGASAHGSWHDGERIETLELTPGIRLNLGAPDGPELSVRYETIRDDRLSPIGQLRAMAPSESALTRPIAAEPSGQVVQTVGRGADNDLVLSDLRVSRRHAELVAGPDGLGILDLESHLGTFVDGQRATEVVILGPESVIRIGSTALRLVNGRLTSELQPTDQDGLIVDHVTVVVGDGLRLVDDVSLTVPPRSLLAVVGPTGAGKSTLLKAITGVRPPTIGRILIDGTDLYASFDEIRQRLGYVPQDDILHHQLTIRKALRFGAELRFPPETTQTERYARVEEVMSELGLTERADLPIDRLSGGQRKRTSVALELLTKPTLLFLDEPTSGLDPGYERSVMQLLRELADGDRVVTVVTHSLSSLDLCDLILFLAPGGRVAYFGSPDGALAHFGKSDFYAVFQALDAGWRPTTPTSTIDDQAQRTRTVPAKVSEKVPATALSRPPSLTWRPQTVTLVRRQFAILLADRRNLLFLALGPLIPAVLLLLLGGANALSLGGTGPRTNARTLVGALVITAAALGAANGIREIVKEEAIYVRERAIGLHRSGYIVSKVVTLGLVTTLQCLVLTVVGTLAAGGPVSGNLLPGRPELIFDVSLTGLATLLLGLLISAFVSTSEKAMAVIPVVFVVSWLFSGIALNLQTKPVIGQLAYLSTANWGVAAAASTVDLPNLEQDACASDQRDAAGSQPLQSNPTTGTPASVPVANCDARWRHGVGIWALDLSFLLILGGILGLLAEWGLARKEPLESERVKSVLGVAHSRLRARLGR